MKGENKQANNFRVSKHLCWFAGIEEENRGSYFSRFRNL
jgi:hypothetical protein